MSLVCYTGSGFEMGSRRIDGTGFWMMGIFNKKEDEKNLSAGVTHGGGRVAASERSSKNITLNFRDARLGWSPFKKIVVASILAAAAYLGPEWFNKLFSEHKGDAGPKIPPHYAYTLKADKDIFERADCPKDEGRKALKHFDSLFNIGISGTKAQTADSVVRAVWNNNIIICAADLPGDQGGMKMKNGVIVIDSTMKGESPAATGVYMILYELNLKRGALTYSPQWSLLERQTHLMSFEAAALMAQVSVAYQKKATGDGSMWAEMALDDFTAPIVHKFEKNVPLAQKQINYVVGTSEVMQVAGKITFPEVFNDPGFAARYNNWLLNVYVKEMYRGELQGRGTSSAHEFATKMGRLDESFNATAGATSAPQFNRFGGDQKMVDAFKMVEMYRSEMMGSPNAGDMNVHKIERQHNAFGTLEMDAVIKSWAESGFSGNFKDHLAAAAGIDVSVPSAAVKSQPKALS